MSAGQMDEFKKELTETEFGKLKAERNTALDAEFKKDAAKFFEDRNEKEIARLPENILKYEEAAPHLTNEALKKIVESSDMKSEDRKKIRVNLEKLVDANVKIYMSDASTLAKIQSESNKKFIEKVQSEVDKRKQEVETDIAGRLNSKEFRDKNGFVDTVKVQAARSAALDRIKTEVESKIPRDDIEKQVQSEMEENWHKQDRTSSLLRSPLGNRL
jgi:hypothetical protein